MLKNCHDCGAKPGGAHVGGCDTERCPFCGGQIITCSCCYEHLGPLCGWEYKPEVIVKKGSPIPEGYEHHFRLDSERSIYTYPKNGLPEEVYGGGLNDDQMKIWETLLKSKGLLPWTGEWPGAAECREFNFYCYWGPPNGDHGWVPCEADHPKAQTDLNRLYDDCEWDTDNKKFVLRDKA